MAVCEHCGNDMSDSGTLSCTGNRYVEYPDGTKLPAIPYIDNDGLNRRHRPLDVLSAAGQLEVGRELVGRLASILRRSTLAASHSETLVSADAWLKATEPIKE